MSSLLKVQSCWSYFLSTWHLTLTWVNARAIMYISRIYFPSTTFVWLSTWFARLLDAGTLRWAWHAKPFLILRESMSLTPWRWPWLRIIRTTMTMARIISMTITTTTHRVQNCDVNHPIVKRICILEPWSVTCDNLPFLWKFVSLQTKKCPREPVSNQPAVPTPKCPIVKLSTVWSDHIAISLLIN